VPDFEVLEDELRRAERHARAALRGRGAIEGTRSNAAHARSVRKERRHAA
jgi:hypothetical protein